MNKIIEKKFLSIQALKEAYIKELNENTAEQIKYKPDANTWSILEVVEHLIKVEAQTFGFIKKFDFGRKDEKVSLRSGISFLLLRLFFKFPRRIAIPTEKVKPEGKHEKEELENEWNILRQEVKKTLQTFSEDKIKHFIFLHPVAGKLNILQTLGFIYLHMLHHRKQIIRIKNTSGYPKSDQ